MANNIIYSGPTRDVYGEYLRRQQQYAQQPQILSPAQGLARMLRDVADEAKLKRDMRKEKEREKQSVADYMGATKAYYEGVQDQGFMDNMANAGVEMGAAVDIPTLRGTQGLDTYLSGLDEDRQTAIAPLVAELRGKGYEQQLKDAEWERNKDFQIDLYNRGAQERAGAAAQAQENWLTQFNATQEQNEFIRGIKEREIALEEQENKIDPSLLQIGNKEASSYYGFDSDWMTKMAPDTKFNTVKQRDMAKRQQDMSWEGNSQVRRDRLAEINKKYNTYARAEALLESGISTGGLINMNTTLRELKNINDPLAQEFEALSAASVPSQRVAGSGTTSDFDAKMFLQATYSLDKTLGANLAIIRANKAYAELDAERMQFVTRWRAAHGTTQNADIVWQKYLDANPVFDKESATPVLSEDRMSFDEWVKAGNAAGKELSYKEVQTELEKKSLMDEIYGPNYEDIVPTL